MKDLPLLEFPSIPILSTFLFTLLFINSSQFLILLLNLIFHPLEISLPSGISIRTEGLSIKYPELEGFENRKIVLLDSAGLETPVLKDENYLQTEENIKEKINNEKEKEDNEIGIKEKEFLEKNQEKNY